MFCQYCGNKLLDNARFCPQCGKSVSEDSDVGAPSKGDGDTVNTATSRQCTASGETLSLSCAYKAPGFLIADRIPGDLVLTVNSLAFRQWNARMLQTAITFGAVSYSTGKGIEWPLSEIQDATVKKGWWNATLSICCKNGNAADFIIAKSVKLDCFMKMLFERTNEHR